MASDDPSSGRGSPEIILKNIDEDDEQRIREELDGVVRDGVIRRAE